MAIRLNIASLGGLDEAVDARSHFIELHRGDTLGHHSLESDPSRADAILFVDLAQHPDDPLLRSLRSHPLVRRYREKIFVYDERDFPTYTHPGIYVGAPQRWAGLLPVCGGPYADPRPIAPVAEPPDLLFSFRGARTHPVRRAVLALSDPRGVVEDSDHHHLSQAGPSDSYQRYEDLTRRAKFVLCPRGQGPSSFRLFETLAYGRIPVIVSDDWLGPPRIAWDVCSVRVAEADVAEIPRILAALEPEWPKFVAAAQTASQEFRRDRLWDHYATSLEVLLGGSLTPRSRWPACERQLHIRARLLRAQAKRYRT